VARWLLTFLTYAPGVFVPSTVQRRARHGFIRAVKVSGGSMGPDRRIGNLVAIVLVDLEVQWILIRYHRGAPGCPPAVTKLRMIGGYSVRAKSGC